eukprot:scaffold21503_cov56-Cyclotella_meneghiniana.AAC.5
MQGGNDSAIIVIKCDDEMAKIGVRYLPGFQKKEGPRRSKSIIQARASALGFRELKCDPSNLEGRGDQTEYH